MEAAVGPPGEPEALDGKGARAGNVWFDKKKKDQPNQMDENINDAEIKPARDEGETLSGVSEKHGPGQCPIEAKPRGESLEVKASGCRNWVLWRNPECPTRKEKMKELKMEIRKTKGWKMRN